MAEGTSATDTVETEEESKEMSLEDVVSQLMVDNMALKSLLIQKEVFKQEDFDATVAAITEEISKDEEQEPAAAE